MSPIGSELTLTDAGALIALLDAGEAAHRSCVETLEICTMPLVTTWPAFTEAMYLLGQAGGLRAQSSLWALQQDGRLELADLTPEALRRAEALMTKYSDLPMDLADATLVALAEHLGDRRIFTLDDGFLVYRYRSRQPFDVIPTRR